MPYELRGSKVVRSDTGEVVKDHHGDRQKALRHLRALKANVEESATGRAYDAGVSARPDLLGALIESESLEERFVSQSSREDLAKEGKALKVGDKVVFPINSKQDAENAKTLYLSGHHQTPAAKAHILKNARRVGATGVVQALSSGG